MHGSCRGVPVKEKGGKQGLRLETYGIGGQLEGCRQCVGLAKEITGVGEDGINSRAELTYSNKRRPGR